jgi:hypothetical protein
MFAASAATAHELEAVVENKTDETDSASIRYETELMEQETCLNFRFLTSMLQMLDLNLNLINEILSSHVKEYPFLQSTIEGTTAGIGTVNYVLSLVELSPENRSDTNSTLTSFNENMAQLNSSLEYPEDVIKAANSTLGEPDRTTPIIADMFKSLKAMIETLD